MSRYDALGMFWEDVAVTGRGRAAERPMPVIPETGWRAPTDFPNLSAAKILSFDTETFDPELMDAGPGWGRGPGKGHVIGASIAVEDGTSWYFPIRHETCPEQNMDPNTVLRWLQHVLGAPDVPKVGANLIYDIGWLRNEGVTVRGRFYDVQYAEALINSETPSVSLDALGQTHLGVGKETSALYQWLADWKGGKPNDKQRKWMYLSPPSLAGPYAEADAKLPMLVLKKQWELMERRGVLNVYDMECRLIPLLLEMRWKGTPIDVEYAKNLDDEMSAEKLNIEAKVRELTGRNINPNSADDIASAFRAIGLDYQTTTTGRASFQKDWLNSQDHPLPKLIVEWREADKMQSVFIQSYILNSSVNGRIHCEFHPLKGDANGTRSGRLSSSNPNLQNIPIRSKMGKRLRRAFVATQKRWRKYDYSQIEYRLLAHHAVGQGAPEIRQKYKDNPHTDYHDAMIEMIKGVVGIELDRRPAKTINFGLIYGMSRGELIRRLQLGPQEGRKLYDGYHLAVPFAKATMDACAKEVDEHGFITTLYGRKSDFPLWAPVGYSPDAKSLPVEEALAAYGMNIERSFKHKALNRKLQGGAADVMKKAMVDCYEAGIFDYTGYPLMTVHDELDFDDALDDPDDPVWRHMINIMQNGFREVEVPLIVEESIGSSWADAD